MIILPILEFFLHHNFVVYVFYAFFACALVRNIFWR